MSGVQAPAMPAESKVQDQGQESKGISELDYTNSSSIIEFLSQEQDCGIEADAETIFQEVSRLSDSSDLRSVDELLLEAERLIQQQLRLGSLGVVLDEEPERHVQPEVKRKAPTTSATGSERSEGLLSQASSQHSSIKLNTLFTRRIEHVQGQPQARDQPPVQPSEPPTPQDKLGTPSSAGFAAFVDNLPSESIISEESTPKDMPPFTSSSLAHQPPPPGELEDNTDDDEDTMEEITEAEVIETIELHQHQRLKGSGTSRVIGDHPQNQHYFPHYQSQSQTQQPPHYSGLRRNSNGACGASGEPGLSRRSSMGTSIPLAETGARPRHSPPPKGQATSSPVPIKFVGPIKPMAKFSEKGTQAADLPKKLVSTLTSPIEQITSSITREHSLKHEIEQLQEQLKDTEERLASVRVQNDSFSQMQRSLRDHNARLQEESEMLKLDVQHLNECANVLRSELQAARKDRCDALDLQKSLRADLEEAQMERRRAHECKEKDARVIQDLQRQCREMERILMRKHPDSVSALIVASKNPGICSLNDQENVNSRKLLEQRIAQLESDAKEQDRKAQQILANVQARFNSVQAKYETHIADLETQVLSLQEINTKLNEQIESQVRTLDRFMQKRADKYYNNCTQTDAETSSLASMRVALSSSSTGTQTAAAVLSSSSSGNSLTLSHPPNTVNSSTSTVPTATRDHSTNTIGCPSPSVCLQQQHSASSSTSSTANSTPNTSRPNSKQSGGLRRPGGAAAAAAVAAAAAAASSSSTAAGPLHISKLPVSQSDSTLSLLSASGNHGGATKEDSQLLCSVRSMRVDLAIKNKAMQRLTRELDDCKKTIRKMQRDREHSSGGSSKQDSGKGHSISSSASSGPRRGYDHDHIPASTENQALKEAQNKYRLLEADYKTLHDKRLHDLKTLQSAHERELASCNETVRILQQRLNEREEAFATQKRRKVPVDYYALKAKVSLLERRHSEREERLHMLVEALSKGRLNGALEDLLQENNNK